MAVAQNEIVGMQPRVAAKCATRGARPRRPRRWCSTQEVGAATTRLVKALGDRVGNGTIEELKILLDLDAELQDQIARAVETLRQFHTDGEIAQVVGTTRQNVSKRWPRQRAAAAQEA